MHVPVKRPTSHVCLSSMRLPARAGHFCLRSVRVRNTKQEVPPPSTSEHATSPAPELNGPFGTIGPADNPIGWTIQQRYGIGGANTIRLALPAKVDVPPKQDGSSQTYEEWLGATAPRRAELQAQAACSLTNISAQERERRGRVGAAVLAATAAVALSMVVAHAAPSVRAGVAPLFWIGYSLLESKRTGLCSIGQAGAWDVDGSGLQYIQDAALAARIRLKVNNMYLQFLCWHMDHVRRRGWAWTQTQCPLGAAKMSKRQLQQRH